MVINNFVRGYFKKVSRLCKKIDLVSVKEVIDILEEVRKNGRKVLVVGNGGSAATAAHMVCDLGKTVLRDRDDVDRFKIVCLSDNIPLLTAVGNDWSYDEIFCQPLLNLGEDGDLLLVITGSGNSKNVIEALKVAKRLKMKTVAFLGFDGGKVKDMVDKYVLVPSKDYGPIEDFHMILVHLMTGWFKKRF